MGNPLLVMVGTKVNEFTVVKEGSKEWFKKHVPCFTCQYLFINVQDYFHSRLETTLTISPGHYPTMFQS